MLKKEASQIVGGLSTPGKMPCYSINLPATECKTGAKLARVPGTTCHGCYALKGRYRFKTTKRAMARRLRAITGPLWVQAMTALITGHKYFRWHDSGDLQGPSHLKNIFEVCKATPGTMHWLPTREHALLQLMDPDVVPKNLKIVLSDHMNDQETPPSWWPYTSGVTTDHGLVTCPASKQGNKCLDCRKCWDRNTKRVIYGKH